MLEKVLSQPITSDMLIELGFKTTFNHPNIFVYDHDGRYSYDHICILHEGVVYLQHMKCKDIATLIALLKIDHLMTKRADIKVGGKDYRVTYSDLSHDGLHINLVLFRDVICNINLAYVIIENLEPIFIGPIEDNLIRYLGRYEDTYLIQITPVYKRSYSYSDTIQYLQIHCNKPGGNFSKSFHMDIQNDKDHKIVSYGSVSHPKHLQSNFNTYPVLYESDLGEILINFPTDSYINTLPDLANRSLYVSRLQDVHNLFNCINPMYYSFWATSPIEASPINPISESVEIIL